jgi:DNA adenine methylase
VGGTYLELFAGGAGAALSLLYSNTFNRIHINDCDIHIYSMWYSILNDTDCFIKYIEDVDVSISEWHKQKNIYLSGDTNDLLSLGFATFFLNRTNRSGIIHKAGPIGGFRQNGKFLISERFNKSDLIKRIRSISSQKARILLTRFDAVEFLNNIDGYYKEDEKLLIYIDPPYYRKGKDLYLNNYNHNEHLNLSKKIEGLHLDYRWIISYDNVDEIKLMYDRFRMTSFELNYSLQSKKSGSELLVFSNSLKLTDNIRVNSRINRLELINCI